MGVVYGDITVPTIFIIKPVDKLNLEIGSEFAYPTYWKGTNKGFENHTQPTYDFEISGLAGIRYNISKIFYSGVRYGMGLTPAGYSLKPGNVSALFQ